MPHQRQQNILSSVMPHAISILEVILINTVRWKMRRILSLLGTLLLSVLAMFGLLPGEHLILLTAALTAIFTIAFQTNRSLSRTGRFFSFFLSITIAYSAWCFWYIRSTPAALNFGIFPYILIFSVFLIIPSILGSVVILVLRKSFGLTHKVPNKRC